MNEATGYEKLTLETLGDGHAIAKVNDELARVAANILDVNTEATTKREVILKIVIIPDENRCAFDIKAQATSKLAPDHACVDRAVVGDDKRFHVPAQIKMFQDQPVIEGSQPRLVSPEGKTK